MNKKANKTLIGVTGNLATGKTAATDILVGLGAQRIDADAISHELLEGDREIINGVLRLFGEKVAGPAGIDRRELAREVFFDADRMKGLCRLLHPAIIKRIEQVQSSMTGPVIALDAPLLIETSLHDTVDVVVLVKAPRELQLRRAMDRGISKKEAEAIIGCQMPLAEKERYADYIIENDKDLDTLKEGVTRIWQKIQKERKKNWT